MGRIHNTVTLIGNIGKDPEVTYFENSSVVAKTTIATTEKWKDKSGEWRETTTWHQIRVWGEFAKVFEKSVRKGMRMTIEGKLLNDQWADADGKNHERIFVQVREFEIHESRRKEQ